MPLPYLKFGGAPTSSLHSLPLALQNGVNLAVSALNWLHLGKPRSAPDEIRGNLPLSGEQRRVVSSLEKSMEEIICHVPVDAASMGRTAAKVENLESLVSLLHRKANHVAKYIRTYAKMPINGGPLFDPAEGEFASNLAGCAGAYVSAKPIVASRLKFGSAPQFNPAPYMDDVTLDRYLHPLKHALPESDSPEKPPRARILGTPEERMRLLQKMDKSGRLKWVPSDQARQKHLNGLFAVPKNLELDRLILDARGPNLLEDGLNRWTQSMGSVQGLLQIHLARGENLLIHSTDLSDYYYHFVISSERVVRNCLAAEYTQSTARAFSSFEFTEAQAAERYRPALGSLAMGDINSVEFGQLSHLSLTLAAGAVSAEELLTLRSTCPRSRLQAGIIIDDLVMLEKQSEEARASMEPGDSEGARRMNIMKEAYRSAKLVQNEKKSFIEACRAQVWGADIDGVKGVVRPIAERLIPVISLTVEVARAGVITKYLLSVLSGFYISVFQFRRRFMSLLEEVFKAPTWATEHTVLEIWPRLESELWTLVALAPLGQTSLRSEYSGELSATDASDVWEAEVSVHVGEQFSREMARHTMRKSVWAKLLNPQAALLREKGVLQPEFELPGEECIQGNSIWQTIMQALPFKTRWRKRIRRKRHINVHELRAVIASEHRRARKKPGCRLVTGTDSQVALGVLTKGRSSSSRLNGVLRQSLPMYVALDISGFYFYVESSLNPADDPTRDEADRGPKIPCPRWLSDALDGDFAGLDTELKRVGLDPVSTMGLPPLSSIVPALRIEEKLCRRERRKQRLIHIEETLGRERSDIAAELYAATLLIQEEISRKSVARLIDLLPVRYDSRKSQGFHGASWSSGAYVYGGASGLRANTRGFWRSTLVLAHFLRQEFPEARFNSLVVNIDKNTPCHRDPHDSIDSVNYVCKISNFEDGGVWVGNGLGDDVRSVQGQRVRGQVLHFKDGRMEFHPRYWHKTEPWSGRRVILVGYAIRDSDQMNARDKAMMNLLSLDFSFPQPVHSPDAAAALSAETAEDRSIRKPSLLEQSRPDPQHRAENLSWEPDFLPQDVVDKLKGFDKSQYVMPRKCKISFEEMILQPGFLDLYSGSRGVAVALANRTRRWVLCVDYAHGPSEDLLRRDLQELLIGLLRQHAFLGVGGGPVCSSFSSAIRPQVRSKEQPLGVWPLRPAMAAKVVAGNSHAAFMAMMVTEARQAEVPAWVENPHNSYLWALPCWRAIQAEYPESWMVLDYCQLGTSWRKRTRFYMSDIGNQRLLCRGGHHHQQLQEYSRFHGKQWTKVAEHYPPRLNHFIAEFLGAAILPVAERRRLDISACAGSGCRRIGEAKKPGPVVSLEEVQLVTPATARLQERVLQGFREWLSSGLSVPALTSLESCAMAYVCLLRAYGDHLFQQSEPMYKFRHLLAWYQKHKLHLRPYMPLAWDMLTRWERLVPVQHRVPMPEALLRAMLALALQRRWFRWAAILAISFYGVARVGEPLRACRRDLLLPSDSLSAPEVGVFLCVRAPQTASRGRGRVQHVCIKTLEIVLYLEWVFGQDSPDEPLYAGSAPSFRRRWDQLLSAFGVDASLGLTPGSLRGGGAVRHYKDGMSISNLMWAMRLRSVVTLESYLQEVSAVSVLARVQPAGRQRVAAASALCSSYLRSAREFQRRPALA